MQAQPEQYHVELRPILQRQSEQLQALVDVITLEQAAIAASDADALVELAGEKHELAEATANSFLQRQNIEKRFEIEHHSSVESFLDWCDASGGLAKLGSEVHRLTELCQNLNMQNGSQVRRQAAHIQQALQVLSGEEKPTNTYGSSGLNENKGASRNLGSA